MDVLLTDPSGMSIDFRLSGPNYSVATVSSTVALSNTAGDTPSGKYDPRNTRISYADNGNRVKVYSTDGATRFYYRKGWTRTEWLYLLEKEILSNGKVLKYHYSNTGQPDYIESLDPKERFVYASIRIQGSPWEGNCHFTSSSGLTASYGYHKSPLQVKIKEKEKHWYGDDKYELNGQNEIGAFASPNEPTNLRVLGLAKDKNSPTTVGVEIEGQVVAPIIDVQGNIRRLIDLDSKAVAGHYDFTAFGEEQRANPDPTLFNPWRFASKRLVKSRILCKFDPLAFCCSFTSV